MRGDELHSVKRTRRINQGPCWVGLTVVTIDRRLVAQPLLAWHELTGVRKANQEKYGEPKTPQSLTEHQCLLNSQNSDREEWLCHQQHELSRVRFYE
jgi:hypothetical protein